MAGKIPTQKDIINNTNAVQDRMEELRRTTTAFNQETTKTGESFVTSYAKAAGTVEFFEGKLSRLALTVGGTGLSIKGMVSAGWQLDQEIRDWGNNLTTMSDASGSTSAALKMMTGSFGDSMKGLAGIQSTMKALNSTGLPVSTEHFKELTLYITNLSHASGIADDTLAQFMGNAIRQFNVSAYGASRMTAAVMESGKAYGLTTGQLEEMMKVAGELHDSLAVMFKDGEKSSIALTQGLSKSIGILNKIGISGQKSGQFLKDMVDPQNMEKNTALLRRLGITYQDQINMMESEDGKKTFFDKLMINLPKLSNELAQIKDPFVRMNLANSLGLPMEIAQKMAGKTRGEIEKMLAEYNETSKADEEKQKKAQAESQKYEETLKFLKMKALLPFMQFAAKWVGTWLKILDNMSGKFQGFGFLVTKIMDKAMAIGTPLLKWLQGTSDEGFTKAFGKTVVGLIQGMVPLVSQLMIGAGQALKEQLPEIMKTVGEYVPKIASSLVQLIGTGIKLFFTDVLPGLVSGLISGFGNIMKESPIFGTLLGGFAIKKAINFGKDFMAGGRDGRLRNIDENVASIAKGKALNSLMNIKDFLKNPKGAMGGIGTKIKGIPGMGIIENLFTKFGSKFGGFVNVFSRMGGVFAKAAPHLIKAIPVVGTVIAAVAGAIHAVKVLSKSNTEVFNQNQLDEKEKERLSDYQSKGLKNLDSKQIADMIDLEGRKKNEDAIKGKIDALMNKKSLTPDEMAQLKDLRQQKKGKGGELTTSQEVSSYLGKYLSIATLGLADGEKWGKKAYGAWQSISGSLTNEQQKSYDDLKKKAGATDKTVSGNKGGALARYGYMGGAITGPVAGIAAGGAGNAYQKGTSKTESLLDLEKIGKMTDEDIIKLAALQKESENMFEGWGDAMSGWYDRMIGTSDVYYQKEMTVAEKSKRDIIKREISKTKNLLSIATGAEKKELEMRLKNLEKKRDALQKDFTMSDSISASISKILGLGEDTSTKLRAYMASIGDYIQFGFKKFLRFFKYIFEKIDIIVSDMFLSIRSKLPEQWGGLSSEEQTRQYNLQYVRKEALDLWDKGQFADAAGKYKYISQNLGMNMNDMVKDMNEAQYANNVKFSDNVAGYLKEFKEQANLKAYEDEKKARAAEKKQDETNKILGGIGGNVAKIKDETVKPKSTGDPLGAYINSLGIFDTSFITR